VATCASRPQVLSAAMTGLEATFDAYPTTRVLRVGVAMAGISTAQGVLLSAGVTREGGGAAQQGGAAALPTGCLLAAAVLSQ
jgi:hypothetical protein